MQTRSMTRKRKLEGVISPVDGKKPPIHKLTDDCLLHVFSFLPLQDRLNVREVCQRWRAFGSLIFRNVTTADLIDQGNEKWKREYIDIIPLCGKFLQDISFFIAKDSTIIQYITKYCRNLKKLRIQFEYFLNLKKYCSNLGKLFSVNQKIESITIEGMQYDFPTYAICLLELPRDLKELELWSYNRGDDDCDDRTPLKSLEPVIRVFTKLERLVLFAMEIFDDDLSVLEAFGQLKSFEIRYSADYCVFDVNPIANLRTLESLALSNVPNTSDEWYTDLVENNPNLKHLYLWWCDLSLTANRELLKLTKLETLTMYRPPCCWRYGYDLSGFRNLKKLKCNRVTDEPVMSLLEMAPELELLNLGEANITQRLLRKAHEVIRRRSNGIHLTIVVPRAIFGQWKKPDGECENLSIVNSCWYHEGSL